jgi:drug/metabolite transporter (DMT)-like permease
MVMAVSMFAIMDALLKALSEVYGPFQLSCMRCLSSLVVLAPVFLGREPLKLLRPGSAILQLLRAGLGVVTVTAFVCAINRLSLARAFSLYLSAPLAITVLSATLLRQKVERVHWLVAGGGMVGVLCVLHPSSQGLPSIIGSLAAIISAVAYSTNAITVPLIARSCSEIGIVFWFLLLVGVFTGLIAILHWHPLDEQHYGVLLGIGVSGALGQIFFTKAFHLSPAYLVAPIEYLSLVWAVAIDWLFWSATPSLAEILGVALIIACGCYVGSISANREAVSP